MTYARAKIGDVGKRNPAQPAGALKNDGQSCRHLNSAAPRPR